jgi:hypothetical protein
MDRSSLTSFLKSSNVDIIKSDQKRPTPPSPVGNINFDQFLTSPSPSPVSKNNASISPPPLATVASPVRVGKLRVGMYNGLVNKNFDDTDRVDLLTLVSKKPLPPQRLENGIVIDVREINGIYGRFQKGITVTRNKGFQGSFSDKYFTIQFKIIVSKGTIKKNISLNVYKNGKIRLSGGIVDESDGFNEPELIRKHIIDNYTMGNNYLYNPIEFNNLSGTILTNAIFDLVKVAKELRASYEPELIQLLYYKEGNTKYIFSTSGVIQVQGVVTMQQLNKAYERAKQLVNKIYHTGGVRRLEQTFKNIPKQKGTKKGVISTCPKIRIPVNGKCPPQNPVLRKNPQGFDCCYKKGKAKTKSISKSKSPVVNRVQLVLDPKGGLKIGTKQCMRYSKGALVNIAKNQGIVNISKKDTKESICVKLVNKFGISQYAPFTHNGKEYIMTGQQNTFKIGRRFCKTYPLETLRAFAKKMNIQFTKKTKRAELCKLIENARVKLPSPPKNTPPPQPKRRGRPPKKVSPNTNSNSNSNSLARQIERNIIPQLKRKSKSKSKSKSPTMTPSINRLKH